MAATRHRREWRAGLLLLGLLLGIALTMAATPASNVAYRRIDLQHAATVSSSLLLFEICHSLLLLLSSRPGPFWMSVACEGVVSIYWF